MSNDNKLTWSGPFMVMENIQTYDLANHERTETRFVKLDARSIQEGLVKEIGISETVILMLLASFSDIDNEAYPSQRAMARMTGLSLPTVNRVVNDLLKKEINGKPILTRDFMMNKLGRRFSVYRLNTVDYSTGEEDQVNVINKLAEDQVNVTTDKKAAIDLIGAEVEPEGDLQVDPVVEAPAKKKTARDHVYHFRSKFEDVFEIPYVVNYGRDTTLIKTKLMPVYSEADIEYLIEYAVDHYREEWANDKYPYPSITMLTSWIANSVMQKRKQAEEKQEELKEILEATRGYENESYDSFDRL